MVEFLSPVFQLLRRIRAVTRTVNGAYINTSQVLISGIDPRLTAVNIPTRHLSRVPRHSHRTYAKRSRKIRNAWLNSEITWAWTSPHRNEKSGYSLMVLAMVLVLSQKTELHAFPWILWKKNEGFGRKKTRGA